MVIDDKMLKPAKNMRKCRQLAFDFYGRNCLYLKSLMLEGRGLEAERLIGVVCLDSIDGSHVFGRGAYAHLKLVPLNVIPMCRYAHNMIDQYKNPLTGKPISKEQRMKLFEKMIGKEAFETLSLMSNRKNCME